MKTLPWFGPSPIARWGASPIRSPSRRCWAYKFLIVGHTVSTGRRDYNLTLSQRRADVIRDILVNTFKISSKRLQSIGLGEEQMLDSAHPTAPANQQFQVHHCGKSALALAAMTPSPV